MRIGLDLDNTLVCYDRVFAAAAAELGVSVGAGGKTAIRDELRRRGDETAWQRLQGQVYGRLMPMAQLMEGAAGFLRRCRDNRVPVWIVSHKTEYGHFDSARVNLRVAARAWLGAQGFFDAGGFALDANRVFFEDDRHAKVARIGTLDFTHFVDDLPEVLDDPGFPASVRRLLYAPDGAAAVSYDVCASWRDIEREVFGD